MDSFFIGLEKILEVTTFYQNISLLHLIFKTEIEVIVTGKAEISQEIQKVKESSSSFILNLEELKGGEEF